MPFEHLFPICLLRPGNNQNSLWAHTVRLTAIPSATVMDYADNLQFGTLLTVDPMEDH